ncbi:hypothetical protein B0H13DRAFT_2339913 [Mycena leptocephala]|nr:hypothetical protein B0H13DRAFT_2339913 [Mycena leptocephala]
MSMTNDTPFPDVHSLDLPMSAVSTLHLASALHVLFSTQFTSTCPTSGRPSSKSRRDVCLNVYTPLWKIAILIDPPHPAIVLRHLNSLPSPPPFTAMSYTGSVLPFPILAPATEPRDSGPARMSAFGTVARVPRARRRRGPSTKIGDLKKFEPVGGVGVHVIVVEDMVTLVLLFLGSFADHLLSEHTPFTVTVLHPLELDHSRFFHSLRSLKLPVRLDALVTRCHVLHLRSRFPTSARKTRSSIIYTSCTSGRRERRIAPNTLSTSPGPSVWGRPHSLEWAYADADSKMTAVWAGVEWRGRSEAPLPASSRRGFVPLAALGVVDVPALATDNHKLEPQICVSGAGAGGAPGARVILLRGRLGIRRLSGKYCTTTPHFTCPILIFVSALLCLL